jgi:glycosyltransferase involved in cell wall biosynthesis
VEDEHGPGGLPTLSVVIPAYRSPPTVAEIPNRVREATAGVASDVEFVFIDDGSPDDTWERLTAIAAADSSVRIVRLLRNYGQHNAIAAGLQHAHGELILTMDDDLQNPPDQIPLLFAALDTDVDLVYGSPIDHQQTRARNMASRMIKRLMAAGLGPDVNPGMSTFRLFRSALLPAFAGQRDPFGSIDVILSWSTSNVSVVPVRFDGRAGGQSGYTLRRLVRHTLNMLTGYSAAPLRFVSALGVFASFVGFALLAYVLIRYAIDRSTVPGFSFLAAAITLFSGVQLLCIGVLGEYMGRIHFRSMGRPPFIVRTVRGAGLDKDGP